MPEARLEYALYVYFDKTDLHTDKSECGLKKFATLVVDFKVYETVNNQI